EQGAVLEISGTDVKFVQDMWSIRNEGMVNWNGRDTIALNDQSKIINNGVFQVSGDSSMTWNNAAVNSRFINNGTLLKLETTNLQIHVLFDNNGRVEVQSGAVWFFLGGTSNSGQFIAATNGPDPVVFWSGTYDF